jgi:alpha-ketoglutarate-dependent taurine dioxygenase
LSEAVKNSDTSVAQLKNRWRAMRKSIEPKPIDSLHADLVRTNQMQPGQTLPLVLEPSLEGVSLADWAANNPELIERELQRHGGLLFRGFGLDTQSAFERFLAAAGLELMHYTEGATPRTKLSDKIYTSTEYPPDQHIALHNELTYVTTWPMKIFFCCLNPPEQQGETPIADVRKVLRRIDGKVIERFTEKGWMLVRNYGEALSLPWQTSFHTADKVEVEDYCRNAQIEHEWIGEQGLRTRQTRPPTARHPRTREMVWFNHIAFWHVSSLAPEVREAMLAIFGEENLPYNTYYGDGSRIEDSIVEEINQAYLEETVTFPWRRGDLLMLDNMLVAHGRRPFTGARRVIVGMGEPSSDRGLSQQPAAQQ